MTFAEIVTEVQARGFSHVSDARVGGWVNAANVELEEAFLWPFREKSATGTAPLTVTDLGTIEAVIDESNNDRPLDSGSFPDLLVAYGDLATAGVPVYFYVGTPSGVPVVATYPTSSHTIGVQYWKVPAELSGSDTPDCPERYHQAIVDIACRRGYYDTDDFEKAQAIQVEIDRQVGVMVNALLGGQQVFGSQGVVSGWGVDS